MRLLRASSTLLLLLTVAAAPPATTVTLDVPGMTCATCPITVKKALSKVPGVSRVEVSYERREAVVTFDETRVAIDQLLLATKNAGYPATVKQATPKVRGAS